MIIRRVDPFSAAKLGGVLYAMLGVLYALMIMAFGSFFAGMMGQFGGGGGGLGGGGMLFGVGSLIILPIIMGIIGFVCVLIGSWIWNIAAKLTGGLQIDVE